MNPTQGGPSNDVQDFFEAKPSPRVGKNVQGDGDTWQETLAVCEAPDGSKLLIRSYYQNVRNGKRVWDEPPSGASQINPATDEMRRMAQLQMQEMQVVTGKVEDTDAPPSSSKSKKGDSNKPKKGKGVGGFFFRRKKDANDSKEKDKRSIQYKSGSKLLAKNKRHNQSNVDETNDLRLQEAIARSIAEAQGIPYSPGDQEMLLSQGPSSTQEDEELEIAKALSMSEAEATKKVSANNGASWPPQDETSEDIMLQAALEESKREAQNAKRVSSEEKQEVQDLLSQFTTISTYEAKGPQVDTWPDDVNKKSRASHKIPTPNRPANIATGSVPYGAASPAGGGSGLKSPPSYSTGSPATAGLKAPPLYSSSPANGMKPPPAYANTPTNGLKSPQVYASSPANGLTSPHSYAVSPMTPTPNYTNATPTNKTAQSPVAMFDPYAKHAPSPAPKQNQEATAALSESTGQGLNKLKEDDGQRARISFGRRSRTKKMQDKAGLV